MAHAKRFSPASLWIVIAAAVLLAAVLLAPQDGNGGKPPGGLPPSAAPAFTVTIKDFAFEPAFLEIPPGSTVRWVYPEGRFNHVVVLRDLDARSPRLYPGQEWTYTFTMPGSYLVLDAVYDSMLASINVTD